jgi:hypothetical protein
MVNQEKKAMSATQAIGISNSLLSESKARVWTGRVITAVVTLFVLFDGITKLVKERHVLQAAADLGFSDSSMVGIGALLLICTAIYLIPRTAVLGAVLMTGYLGGAVAVQVRIGHPLFEDVFPIIFATLVWAGLLLREPRVGGLLPLRKQPWQQ